MLTILTRVLVVFALMTTPVLAKKNKQKSLVKAGPMLGYVDLMEALVWIQLTESASVHLVYWAEGGEKQKTDVVRTNKSEYFIAKLVLENIEPGTTYDYKVMINDKEVTFDYPLKVKTQPLWRWRTEPPNIRFLLGSCLYSNDPAYDRPGKGYGDSFQIFKHMTETESDFMLWLGDNTYFREPEFNSVNRLAYRHSHSRSLPEIQELLATRAHYAIWDDHDFGPNDSNRTYAFKDGALDLFKRFWGNPHYGFKEMRGTMGLMQWGDIDFFFLDNRFHRAPNTLNDDDKPYLGQQQLQWLKESLVSSKASFKFIVNGNQVLNIHSQHESYSKYPAEYADFMTWLDSAKVNGVIFLSGDRHFSEIIKKERVGNYPLYEFTSSPMTSGLLSDMGSEMENPLRVPGTLVHDKRNFGIIDVTGPRKNRVLKISVIDETGKLRFEHSISRTDVSRRSSWRK